MQEGAEDFGDWGTSGSAELVDLVQIGQFESGMRGRRHGIEGPLLNPGSQQ